MTLTRPAYQVIVENVTAGWSYQATQHDDSTLGDDVQLADGLTMGWAFVNGQAPGALEPDQVTFRLLGTSAAVLPTLDIGDEVVVQLLRPTAGDPITYMKFLGRTTEPTLAPVGRDRILATVTANGYLADLAGRIVSDRKWPETNTHTEYQARYERLAQLAQINTETAITGYTEELGSVEVDSRSALELLVELANSQAAGDRVVIRPMTLADYVAEHPFDPPPVPQFQYGPGSDIVYAFQTMDPDQRSFPGVTGHAPYRLVKDGLIAEMQRIALDTGDLRQISAAVMNIDAGWRKDKADAINQFVYQGIAPATDPDASATIIAQHSDLVAKYGANPLTFTTQVRDPASKIIITDTDEVDPATAFLPPYDDAVPDWSVDKLTIRTELMDDADLDRYAPTYYPTPTADNVPSRLIVLDVVDHLAVNGAAITGFLIGCTFEISAGELTITPQLRNETLKPSTIVDGITPATLAASPTLATTTVANAAALHIDPTIRVRDIALATL